MNLVDLFSRTKNRIERALHGYGHRDRWSFDSYLAGMLSRALDELADDMDRIGVEDDSDELRSIARDLRAYYTMFDDIDGFSQTKIDAAGNALKRLAERFEDLWT